MAKKRTGKIVVFDGIDGSGKGTLVQSLARWARSEKLRVLNVVAFEQRRHRLPEPEEIQKYDVLLTAEPTHSLVGRAIRQELISHNDRQYTAAALAQAYALDRYILLRRVIIPAVEQGIHVFQERSLSTSLVYQPMQAGDVTEKYILSLDGNKLAMQYRPDLLCILKTDVDEVIRRLGVRVKKDNAIFERAVFLRRAQKRFLDRKFHQRYQQRGSHVAVINTDVPVRQSARQVRQLWQELH